MAGLVQVRLRWSTRWRSPSPAEVVRSCSKELGKSTASEMKLSANVSYTHSSKLQEQCHSHGQLFDDLAEAVVVLYVRQLARIAGAKR